MSNESHTEIEDAEALEVGPAVSPGGRRVLLPRLPVLTWQGSTPDCGPHALAMASTCVLPIGLTPARCAQILRYFRLPRIGATMPMGLAKAAGWLGLRVRAGLLGTTSTLRSAIDHGHPVVILVHNDDLTTYWMDLHFRVVVGYEADTSNRVTRLLLACSATPHDVERGWNLAQPTSVLYRQWHNWALPRWYAEVWSTGS